MLWGGKKEPGSEVLKFYELYETWSRFPTVSIGLFTDTSHLINSAEARGRIVASSRSVVMRTYDTCYNIHLTMM